MIEPRLGVGFSVPAPIYTQHGEFCRKAQNFTTRVRSWNDRVLSRIDRYMSSSVILITEGLEVAWK